MSKSQSIVLQYAEIDGIASTLFHWTVCHFINSWQHTRLSISRNNARGDDHVCSWNLHPFNSRSLKYKADLWAEVALNTHEILQALEGFGGSYEFP